IVVLARNKALPGYLGTVKVTLPYDKLGKAFILGAEAAPEPPTELPAVPSTEPPTNPTIPNLPPQNTDIDPSKPMIALTFDDGPSKYTPQILDILERYGCRATFCVVGNLVDARKDTVKRASDLGCEVIGHSWDHRDLSKLSAEEIKEELNDTSAVIESATGVSPRMYRPPYGAVGGAVKSTSAQLGYAMIHWSVDPEDWKTRNADAVYSAVMGHANDRAIILSHDLYGSTVDAYARIIPELLFKGYQLVTVSELMYYSGITLEAGVVYYSGN
ncbi:MAG: polysaccharide deacetylase family protein, partial [Oscillospiraceae bacterium]|nr:polysaccharide deacetylase family protein [Oscillospiraceae bacterium]